MNWPTKVPCCACRKATDSEAGRFVLLDFEGPPPVQGKTSIGWGCVVCGLPSRGAIAFICDQCSLEHREIVDVFVGFHDTLTTPIAGLSKVPFQHNMRFHPEAAMRN